MRKINLFAGPGSGKSTVQGILYGLLKRDHFSVEMVREYAKDLVYDGVDLKNSDLSTQVIIFAEQLQRELILKKGGIDIAIADSPLLLNAFYSNAPFLMDLSIANSTADDINIWLHRYDEEHFESDGRCHNEKESKTIDKELQKFLKVANVKLIFLKGTSEEKATKIKEILEKGIKNE
jgi:hypothetical protein